MPTLFLSSVDTKHFKYMHILKQIGAGINKISQCTVYYSEDTAIIKKNLPTMHGSFCSSLDPTGPTFYYCD